MVNCRIRHRIQSQRPMPQLPTGAQGSTLDFTPMGCHSEVLLHAPGMPKIRGEGSVCRACLYRHLYALLHPQKSFGSLSVGDPSKLLRPIFKYLRASSQDYTNREATDRQQAGRNHTDTRKRNTLVHTSCKAQPNFPSGVQLQRTNQMIQYIIPAQR